MEGVVDTVIMVDGALWSTYGSLRFEFQHELESKHTGKAHLAGRYLRGHQ